MEIVIMEFKDPIHLGNSHWFCFAMPPGSNPKVFEMMGHKVVKLSLDEAEDLLERARISLELQFQLREMCYPSPNTEAYPVLMGNAAPPHLVDKS